MFFFSIYVYCLNVQIIWFSVQGIFDHVQFSIVMLTFSACKGKFILYLKLQTDSVLYCVHYMYCVCHISEYSPSYLKLQFIYTCITIAYAQAISKQIVWLLFLLLVVIIVCVSINYYYYYYCYGNYSSVKGTKYSLPFNFPGIIFWILKSRSFLCEV